MANTGAVPPDAAQAAQELAAALEQGGEDYAFGGAIALGYWGEPRATVDVDLTLFLAAEEPYHCIRYLQRLGCEVDVDEAANSLGEHGFCRAFYRGVRLDVFLPTIPFYEIARQGRVQVPLGGQPIMIWNAEVLAVFKMMFFRRKDVADLEQILRIQGRKLDRGWVRERLVEIFGKRDPRLSTWDELCTEIND